jgi:hypothetical protein
VSSLLPANGWPTKLVGKSLPCMDVLLYPERSRCGDTVTILIGLHTRLLLVGMPEGE